MDKIIRIAILCVVAVGGFARPAAACSCALRPVCTAESFRGPNRGDVEIVGRGIGGSCAYAFVDGTRYLVYARRGPDGGWRSYFCDPTVPLGQASEGLAFARGVARDIRRGGSLFGSVLVAERDGILGLTSPLSQVLITVRGGTQGFSTSTDSAGRYEFSDIAPGQYMLTVSASTAIVPIPPATIQIKGPGACVVHIVTAVRRPPG